MAKYREISDPEVAVGAPITQQLMHALKDNPLAYRENDTTAPQISYKALQSPAEPSAGEVIICQAVGHIDSDALGTLITGKCAITIRRKGAYRIRLTVRSGTATFAGSDDGNIDSSTATIGVQRFSGDNSFDPYFLNNNSLGDGNKLSATIDQKLDPNDYLLVVPVETDSPMELSIVLTVGVSDTNAIYGVDAIARTTSIG